MPVDSLVVFKTRQVLWPAALVQSFWSFGKVMLIDDMKRIGTRLGFYTGAPPPTMEQIVAQHQKQLQKLVKDDTPAKPNSAPTQKTIQPQPLGDAKKTMSPALTDKNPSAGPDKDTSTAKVPGQTEVENALLGASKAIHAHYFRAIVAFKHTFAQKWRPIIAHPPRGCILVGGLVEIDAPKAWLVFDVRAAWDPKSKSFDAPSMNLQLRRIQMKKQQPLR